MLKKRITYTDYKDNERTEDFYFNLSKAEVMEMEMTTTGGFKEQIDNLIEAQDMPAVVKIFKDIILKAYGKKSEDGRQFIKNDELRTAFSQTEAYSILFMELSTNTEAAANFMNGIIPNVPKPVPAQVTNI